MATKEETSAELEIPKAEDPSEPVIYTEGEKVLAYHGPQVYEAKIQKVEFRKEKQKLSYYVHYLGWSKNWDEWVDPHRLMKHTAENIQKQADISKKQGVDKNSKSGRLAQIKPKSSTEAKTDKEDLRNNVGRGKKRKVESGIEEDTVSADKHVKIQIPATLKKQLVDDCEYVTQLGKLVKLPRSPSVDDIIKKYIENQGRKGMIAPSLPEVLKGLRDYFNKALPMLLLYQQEREQYRETIRDNVLPSKVYGAEHMLRLYVKLPELLSYVPIDEDTVPKLQQELVDFLKYMQKNQSTFFLSTYGSKVRTEEDDGCA